MKNIKIEKGEKILFELYPEFCKYPPKNGEYPFPPQKAKEMEDRIIKAKNSIISGKQDIKREGPFNIRDEIFILANKALDVLEQMQRDIQPALKRIK